MAIRIDWGGEFINESFVEYCEKKEIKNQLSAPRIPQQNRVVERRKSSLVEMARALLNDQNLPEKFWAEVINTTCYICNKCLVRPLLGKTAYEVIMVKSLQSPTLRCLALNFKSLTPKINWINMILKIIIWYFLDIHKIVPHIGYIT